MLSDDGNGRVNYLFGRSKFIIFNLVLEQESGIINTGAEVNLTLNSWKLSLHLLSQWIFYNIFTLTYSLKDYNFKFSPFSLKLFIMPLPSMADVKWR